MEALSTVLSSRIEPRLTKVRSKLRWQNEKECGVKYQLYCPLGRGFEPVMIPGLDPNVSSQQARSRCATQVIVKKDCCSSCAAMN